MVVKAGVDSGYFNDFAQLVRAVTRYNRRAEGIYITLNPVHPALLARAANRIRSWSTLTTADSDIPYRRWLPIDIDPIRPSGISSTDDEHELALQKADDIQRWLAGCGWPPPLFADSGNGAHLLYRIDMGNNDEVTRLVQRCLQAIAHQFDDQLVKVDVGNYNAARIWKLYYTLTAKGDSTQERPHRWSQIISAQTPLDSVTTTQLEGLAKLAPTSTHREATTTYRHFDVDTWLAKHGLTATKSTWKDGWRWRLSSCPFSDAHTDGAYIIQFASGAISAGCHHNSCRGKSWRDLRALYEQIEWESTQDREFTLRQLIRSEVSLLQQEFLTALRTELRTSFSPVSQP
ncbi:MAG: hypothetical protein R2867_37440 [Caldilineaceae bacterium]